MRFLFCRVYIDLIILYFFTLAMVHMEMLVTFPKKWLYFSSPTFNVKLFYKNRYKIIFVKMGLGSGQQHFGKSNNIVLILMPDYLFTSQSESIFFSCKSTDRISFEDERQKTIPAPEDQRVDPLAILYCVPRH